MHDSSFGKEVFILGATLSGDIPVEGWKEILPKVMAIAGLRQSHDDETFEYDDELGYIHIQPIITSFIVLDAWPDHKGAYLHICSCKEFNANELISLLSQKYKILETVQHRMKLP